MCLLSELWSKIDKNSIHDWNLNSAVIVLKNNEKIKNIFYVIQNYKTYSESMVRIKYKDDEKSISFQCLLRFFV